MLDREQARQQPLAAPGAEFETKLACVGRTWHRHGPLSTACHGGTITASQAIAFSTNARNTRPTPTCVRRPEVIPATQIDHWVVPSLTSFPFPHARSEAVSSMWRVASAVKEPHGAFWRLSCRILGKLASAPIAFLLLGSASQRPREHALRQHVRHRRRRAVQPRPNSPQHGLRFVLARQSTIRRRPRLRAVLESRFPVALRAAGVEFFFCPLVCASIRPQAMPTFSASPSSPPGDCNRFRRATHVESRSSSSLLRLTHAHRSAEKFWAHGLVQSVFGQRLLDGHLIAIAGVIA